MLDLFLVMNETRTCQECGAALPADAPAGLCPCCLWDAGTAQTAATTEEREPSPAVFQGRPFGNYDLLEELARGGMGVVYKARQRNLSRLVALKMIRGERLAQASEVQRFRREATAAATLHHPHIVSVHEAGEVDGQYFYSMDFVEGRSLAEVVREHPLPARQAATYLKAIAEAVAYAHQRGILHRDLKPSNVLIDTHDQPHVVDFGLAKSLPGSELPALNTELTQSGQVLGSPSYMAPEQAAGHGRAVDARTDVYALGAILYEMLSGRPPFQAETSLETLKLVLENEPAAPRLLNPRLPRDLETLCLKCLEKEPRRRYAGAQDLVEELGRFLENKPIVARPVSVPEKLRRWCQRKPLVAGLAGGLLLACLWNLSRTPLAPLLGSLALGLALAGWFGWRAGRSARQLRSEKVQRAIDAALTAALGGDRAVAEQAIQQAEQQGAPKEWVRMLKGQIALHTLSIDAALQHFEAAVSLAPRSVAARAMLATAFVYNGQYERFAEMLGTLDQLSPETPEDYLFLGAAMVPGHPDSAKPVALLEQAKQKRPTGVTFLQLALAEGFHAIDAGSWLTVQRAMDHCEWASEILGPEYPMVLTTRLNGYNFALRLCPEGERAALLEKAAGAARALESTPNPIGRMQRAFYFEILGDEEAAVEEWRQAFQRSGTGVYAFWYAIGMLGRGRSAEALETMNRMGPSTDALTAIARASLLLDQNLPEAAEQAYQQVVARLGSLRVLGEAIPLLAGQSERVATNCARLLEVIPAQHPDYSTLQFLAGESSRQEFLDRAAASGKLRGTAHYWIGSRCLAQGDRETAAEHFARSVETRTHWWLGFRWSRAFLARLEADPHWPPWIGVQVSQGTRTR